MNARRRPCSFNLFFLILQVAAFLVPDEERAEWLAEWKAELWHVRHTCESKWVGPLRSEARMISFCLGSFQDAAWFRRNRPHAAPRRAPQTESLNPWQRGSPSRCALSLTIAAGASFLMVICLPGARKALMPAYNPHLDGLVMISPAGNPGPGVPEIPFAEYQLWQTNTHHLFKNLAYYRPAPRHIHIARHQTADLVIARASDNLFDLLHVTTSIGRTERPAPANTVLLFLSHEAWHRYFHDDAQVAGRILQIAGQSVQVAGIVSGGNWQLPEEVDGWMLEDERHLDMLSANSKGFVLADIKPSAFTAPSAGPRYMTVSREDGGADRFDLVGLNETTQQPVPVFLFTLMLACLALPATTPLPLGDYPIGRNQLSSAMAIRRWSFLLIKIALIVPTIYFGSLALAYNVRTADSPACQYVQLITSFLGLLFAFRWALQDQRRRCPVCLRRLTNPARVGEASRNFLAWNGTEWICAGGHGLLHIPGLPTSWFSTQRWLYLDPSWSSLFSKAAWQQPV